MRELTAHFTVKEGKLVWKIPDYLRNNIAEFEDCKGVVFIKKKWSKRSHSQNRYMWLCFEEIGSYTGHTSEEIHTICKGLYCPKKHVSLKDREYTVPKGTSELSKGEMVEFMLHVTELATSLGIILKSPEDYQRELDNKSIYG